MATRSSILAWRIPGSGEPGGLPSMGSHRIGHDCFVLCLQFSEVCEKSLCFLDCQLCFFEAFRH